MFADDTVLILHDKNRDKLNEKANTEAKIPVICEWLTSNRLTLNQSKTSYMLFSPKQTSTDKLSLYIRGEKINKTPVAKYLGIHIDEKRKFDVHAKHVCKKLLQICDIFCYRRYYINQRTLLMLYHSLVNSPILYGILAWSLTNHSILQLLQVLQNKHVRIIIM